jgi:NAD(P)-dependent dehydrogenase (short-subunit alcohol dehydrogenase family)
VPTVLITGAGRGLGYEFAKQYAANGWTVLATCRDESGRSALAELVGPVEAFMLDVTDAEAVGKLAHDLKGRPIDLLINNAGIMHDDDGNLGEVGEETLQRLMSVNAFAPVRVVEALCGNVEASDLRRIIAISSDWASIGGNDRPGPLGYRASKAALNALMRCIAMDLGRRGVTTVMIHPGWVRTDMGGQAAKVGVDESVTHMRGLIDRLTPDMNGRFFDRKGEEMAW